MKSRTGNRVIDLDRNYPWTGWILGTVVLTGWGYLMWIGWGGAIRAFTS